MAIESGSLIQEEKTLAEAAIVSASDFGRVADIIAFPKKVEGLTMLDIGGGASTVTLELNKRGARAVAIDYKYLNFEHLISSLNKDAWLTNEGGQDFNLFLKAFKVEEKPYIAALASHLPFENNTFDFCFSLYAISSFISLNKDVLLQSINEGLRVLNPGGQLQIYPWTDPQWLKALPNLKDNFIWVVESLQKQRIEYSIEQINYHTPTRLRIIKPGLPK